MKFLVTDTHSYLVTNSKEDIYIKLYCYMKVHLIYIVSLLQIGV